MSTNNKSNYRKIIASGREEKCEICGLTEWRNNPILLQVHHIDGNRQNNDLSNLQLLCPNCHSQTDNWCSKNRKNKTKEIYYCSKCGKELSGYVPTGLCSNCYKQVERDKSKCPTKEQLIQDCKELMSYAAIAKKYKVSDKTISKWCKKFGFTIFDYAKNKHCKQENLTIVT